MSNSNEIPYWIDIENTTDHRVNYFVQLAQATLKEVLPDDDRKALEMAAQRLPEAYRLLKENLATIGVEEPMRLRTIYQMLCPTIIAVSTIGASLSQTKKVKMIHMASQFEGASRGGKKSAAKRIKKKETWRKIAKPMIEDLIAKYPEMSQDDIASDVKAGWKHLKPNSPGHSTLKAFVAEIQNNQKNTDNVLKFK